MTRAAICALLAERIGLDPTTIGEGAISQAVRTRMAAAHLHDEPAYLARLRASPAELDALVEEVVVPETWFFRDGEPFHFLARHVRDTWQPAHPTGVLRVLSMPCATGEEPYSVAMTLLDLHLPPDRFHIEAVDVSTRALAKARAGLYTRHSFRGKDLGVFRERYFSTHDGRFQLCERVRQCVYFFEANLAKADFLLGHKPYDVIFCRNVLIYFDPPTRQRAVAALLRLLKPDGVVFVGHAETVSVLGPGFVSIGDPRTFAFYRTDGPYARPRRAHEPMRTAAVAPPAPAAPPPVRRSSKPAPPAPAAALPPPSVEQASQLANENKLDQAAAMCEAVLKADSTSADAYALLGVVRLAQGELKAAEDCFHKAVYLDHHHVQALSHLSLILERRGERARAATVRLHAQRAEAAKGTA